MKNRWLREQLARWKEIRMVLRVKRIIRKDGKRTVEYHYKGTV